jgi:2-polyprenyl-3-methyl-5-hydroxy-6-metoxy-1,4-benzoquinol methylase
VQYDFQYSDTSAYAAVRVLLARFELAGGLVVDLGCGNCPLADVVRELGGEYVGVDTDAECVSIATGRGIESHQVDLAMPDVAVHLDKIVSGRRVAAVLALDVLEHLVDPAALLTQLHAHASEQRTALVISVPNVTHADLGGKLLAGRWDVTPTGLLDRTHLRFFTSDTIDELLRGTGWHEVGRRDFHLRESDQHFPAGHPVLATGSLVADHLRLLRAQADEFGDVNQFVRAYLPGPTAVAESAPGAGPFLSIVMRTMGAKPDSMIEALSCLGGQTDQDWELIVSVHGDDRCVTGVREVVDLFDDEVRNRIRVTSVLGGTRARPANRGLELATGSYVAFFDDDDFVTADWVEAFHRGADQTPGAVIRSWCADRDVEPPSPAGGVAPYRTTSGLRPTFTTPFDLVQHLYENRTPLHSFAVPRDVVTELGITWNDELMICEDWDFLLRCALWCGVNDTGTVTAVYNRWHKIASLHTVPQWSWNTSREWVRHQIDSRPFLMPPGSVGRLTELYEASLRVDQLEAQARNLPLVTGIVDGDVYAELQRTRDRAELAEHAAHHLRLRVADLESSTSWRLTAPLRFLTARLGRTKQPTAAAADRSIVDGDD